MVGMPLRGLCLRQTSYILRARWVRVMMIASTLIATPVAIASGLPVFTVPRGGDIVPGMHASQIVAPRGFFAALDRARTSSYSHLTSTAIPSFSRQTKLACSACHYAFPQLTPFGRQFKLNGYTLTGLSTIGEPTDTAGGRQSLKLAPIAPVAAMVVASLTNTRVAQPGLQNNTASFPQQASIFVAGQITPNIGAFTQ